MGQIGDGPGRNRQVVAFLLVFVIAFVALQQAYLRTRNLTGNILTDTLNARPAAAIINILDPSADVVANGSLIASSRGGVDIKKGCEGFEVIIILLSALLAYPASLRHRLVGILVGMVLVYAINLVRIVSLFFIFVHMPSTFDFAHLFLWQALIIAGAVAYFILWIDLHERQKHTR